MHINSDQSLIYHVHFSKRQRGPFKRQINIENILFELESDLFDWENTLAKVKMNPH